MLKQDIQWRRGVVTEYMLITIITKHNEEVCRLRHDGQDVFCVSGHKEERFDYLFEHHNEERYAWVVLLYGVRKKMGYDIRTIC